MYYLHNHLFHWCFHFTIEHSRYQLLVDRIPFLFINTLFKSYKEYILNEVPILWSHFLTNITWRYRILNQFQEIAPSIIHIHITLLRNGHVSIILLFKQTVEEGRNKGTNSNTLWTHCFFTKSEIHRNHLTSYHNCSSNKDDSYKHCLRSDLNEWDSHVKQEAHSLYVHTYNHFIPVYCW